MIKVQDKSKDYRESTYEKLSANLNFFQENPLEGVTNAKDILRQKLDTLIEHVGMFAEHEIQYEYLAVMLAYVYKSKKLPFYDLDEDERMAHSYEINDRSTFTSFLEKEIKPMIDDIPALTMQSYYALLRNWLMLKGHAWRMEKAYGVLTHGTHKVIHDVIL